MYQVKRPYRPPNCYECKHRRAVPGSAHSACGHPKLGKSPDNLLFLLSFLAKQNNVLLPFRVEAKEYGIRMGWFNWPVDFDPVWLLECDGFEKKETEEEGD